MAVDVLRVVGADPHNDDVGAEGAEVLFEDFGPVVEIRSGEAGGALADGEQGDVFVAGHGFFHLRPHGFHEGVAGEQDAGGVGGASAASRLQVHGGGGRGGEQEEAEQDEPGKTCHFLRRFLGEYLKATSMRACAGAFASLSESRLWGFLLRKSEILFSILGKRCETSSLLPSGLRCSLSLRRMRMVLPVASVIYARNSPFSSPMMGMVSRYSMPCSLQAVRWEISVCLSRWA